MDTARAMIAVGTCNTENVKASLLFFIVHLMKIFASCRHFAQGRTETDQLVNSHGIGSFCKNEDLQTSHFGTGLSVTLILTDIQMIQMMGLGILQMPSSIVSPPVLLVWISSLSHRWQEEAA